MTNANEQMTSKNVKLKAWSEPKLDKIEINATASGEYAGGSFEGSRPAYPAS